MGISIMHMAKEVAVTAAEHDQEYAKEAEEVNRTSRSKIQGVRRELWKPGRAF